MNKADRSGFGTGVEGRASVGPQGIDARVFAGASLIVGVTGGIAAYKSAAIVSRLAQWGAQVTVLMTKSATRFVTPLTFQSLSARPVYTDMWEHIESHDPQHIALARRAAGVLIAPCTMDCMAKLAAGRADDVVTLALSAVDRRRTPVLLAPSMNAVMWSQPATMRNAETLIGDGFDLVGPSDGWQACREVGPGRMSEPDEIVAVMASRLAARRHAEA